MASLIGRGLSHSAVTYRSDDNKALKLYTSPLTGGDHQEIRYDKFKNEATILKKMESSDHVLNVMTEFRETAIHNSEKKIAPYYAMELMEGDLHNLILSSDPTLAERIDILLQVTKGIMDCHLNGVCHRDIYTPNVLYKTSGDTYLCKITDFGSAKEHGRPQTKPYFYPTGNMNFTPPEAIVGLLGGDNPDPSMGVGADVFALGMLYYEILTYTLPEALLQSLADVLQQVRTDGMWNGQVDSSMRQEYLEQQILPVLSTATVSPVHPDAILSSEEVASKLNQLIKGMTQLDYRSRDVDLSRIYKDLSDIHQEVILL